MARRASAILAVGGPEDLREYGLNPKRFMRSEQYNVALHAEVLARLIKVAGFRDIRPAGDLAAPLNSLIDEKHPKLRAHALALAGIWKVEEAQDRVLAADGPTRLRLS